MADGSGKGYVDGVTVHGKLDGNRRPAFPIGRTPDASCSAEPDKKMPLPVNSNEQITVQGLSELLHMNRNQDRIKKEK